MCVYVWVHESLFLSEKGLTTRNTYIHTTNIPVGVCVCACVCVLEGERLTNRNTHIQTTHIPVGAHRIIRSIMRQQQKCVVEM